jgi:hypothetical protein
VGSCGLYSSVSGLGSLGAPGNMVMKFWVPHKVSNFLTSLITICFPRTLIHGDIS